MEATSRTVIDLGGGWSYRTLDGPAREGEMPVPSNWHKAGLENHAGAVEFRRRFQGPALSLEQTARLVFHGVDYFAEVTLNGTRLGSHEGYFQRFAFDVTDVLAEENELVVRVDAPREPLDIWPNRKRLIKGIFQHHDCRPGSWSPSRGQDEGTGGIWNRVELVVSATAYVDSLRVAPTLMEDGSARLRAEATVVSRGRRALRARLVVAPAVDPQDGLETSREVILQPGVNDLGFVVTVPSPRLWWTWDHGAPDLYWAGLHLLDGDEELDRLSVRFGIREVKIDEGWTWTLNGRRFFPRGTNIIPTQWLSEYDQEMIGRDARLLREANVNGVRVHAHVQRSEMYDVLDEAGILVWQDFALQWSYEESDEFAQEACRQIQDMVRQLYNHPCIAVWCCHNEPSVNRTTLDPLLAAAARQADSSRFVDVASDFRFHTYPGWYQGSYREFTGLPAAPFVTEFGAQALPDVESLRLMFSPEDMWPPNWDEWTYHDFQYHWTFHLAGVEMGESIEELAASSQAYQAKLLQFAIETYRRERHRRITGLFQFMFMDCWPAITWSVVDYWRRPKEGYYALQRAYQPVLPSIRLLTDEVSQGMGLRYEVYVLNDLHRGFRGAVLSHRVRAPDGGVVFEDEGALDVPADGLVRHRRFHPDAPGWIAPGDASPGRYAIEVELVGTDGKVIADNRAAFRVVEAPVNTGRDVGT
jgi:beta-mannosidase